MDRRKCFPCAVGALLLFGCSELSSPEPARNDSIAEITMHEGELIIAINYLRGQMIHCGNFGPLGPAPPLVIEETLQRTARMHSQDMGVRGFFAHINPDGADTARRARAQGFKGPVGENIAWGLENAGRVTESWQQSPEHCRAMMNSRFNLVGTGYSLGAAHKPFWTLVVGQR
jgi:uncharacterized protein YkwD